MTPASSVVVEPTSSVKLDVSDVLSACPSVADLVESVPGAELLETLTDGRATAILRLASGLDGFATRVVVSVAQLPGGGWHSRWAPGDVALDVSADLTVVRRQQEDVPASRSCELSSVVRFGGTIDIAVLRRVDILLDTICAQTARNLEALVVCAQQHTCDAEGA